MAITVQSVPLQYINATLPHVEKFLAASVAYSDGELTLDAAKVFLTQGMWDLIVAVDDDNTIHGMVTVQYFNRIDHRVAFITNIGGRLLAKPELFSQLVDILKSNGATCIEGSVRESLMRLWARLGARKKAISIQIAL